MAFQTEVLACLETISFAVHHGFTRILADCLLLVQCFTNAKFIPYFLINVFDDVRVQVCFPSYCHVHQ